MIQRVQSLYLLAAAAVMGSASVVKLAYFSTPTAFFDLRAVGLYSTQGELVEVAKYMVALFVVSAILPLVTVFLFKNRPLQSMLCKMTILLVISSIAMMLTYVYMITQALGVESSWFSCIKPAAALILLPLPLVVCADRAICKDEALVRSLDRIR